jgi:hypothetical protein
MMVMVVQIKKLNGMSRRRAGSMAFEIRWFLAVGPILAFYPLMV